MLEFFTSPVGLAIIWVLAVAVLILLVELNYKFIFKYILDFIFSLIFIAVIGLPVIIIVLYLKIKYKKVFSSSHIVGVRGKPIKIIRFALKDENGQAYDGFCAFLLKIRFENAPLLFCVLSQKMSIIGPVPLTLSDSVFISDEHFERFSSRPGIISPLCAYGNENILYEEAFDVDITYVKKRQMFRDIFIFFKGALSLLKDDRKDRMGEMAQRTYAQSLLARGEITDADFKDAVLQEEKVLEEEEKAKQFKKEKFNKS